jgi:hypothetical protein
MSTSRISFLKTTRSNALKKPAGEDKSGSLSNALYHPEKYKTQDYLKGNGTPKEKKKPVEDKANDENV